MIWCNVIRCYVIWCNVIRCYVLWFNVIWCYVIWCDVIWCYATKYNKKAQHRSWHTAKCNKLYQLKWNINAWDTVMHLHGRHFVRHLGICNPICIKLLQLMWSVITNNSVKKNEVSILINGWVIANYSVSRPPFCPPSWNLFLYLRPTSTTDVQCHYAQFSEKNEVSILINGWVTVSYSVSWPPFCLPSWDL